MSAALITQGVGKGLEAYGQYQQGKLSRSLGRARKKLAITAGKQAIASAQRVSLEQTRQAELLASRALAVASAGGGGADDASVTKIIADIEGEGAYRAALAMYEGEETARKLRYEGEMAEFKGDTEYKAGKLKAASTLGAGSGSMYSTYKMGGYG